MVQNRTYQLYKLQNIKIKNSDYDRDLEVIVIKPENNSLMCIKTSTKCLGSGQEV